MREGPANERGLRAFVVQGVALEPLHHADAVGAHGPIADAYDLLGASAQHAGVPMLLEDDLLAVHGDRERVLDVDPECPAQFHRYDDAPEVVHAPDNAGIAHSPPPSSIVSRC